MMSLTANSVLFTFSVSDSHVFSSLRSPKGGWPLYSFYLELAIGIEPMTSSLPRKCSTNWATQAQPSSWWTSPTQNSFWAGDGTRTRDQQLGRLWLYQLSYSRQLTNSKNFFFDLSTSLNSFVGWWVGKDSNLRRREPSDLQSDAFNHFATYPRYPVSWRWDSNPRPADYKSAALPTELRQQNFTRIY